MASAPTPWPNCTPDARPWCHIRQPSAKPALTEADVTREDYMLALAIHALYKP